VQVTRSKEGKAENRSRRNDKRVSQVDRQPIALVRGRRGAFEADIKRVTRSDANMYKGLEPNENPAKDAKTETEN